MDRPSDLLIRERLEFIAVQGTRGSMRLLESPSGDDIFNDDGSVNVVLLRPCAGRGPAGVGGGPGRRVYTPEVLERDSGVFTGWQSFLNHDSPAARRARMGLPRGPDELAGEIQESWWEPTLTTPEDDEMGFKPGATVGKFMPATDLVESLLRRIPKALRWSINGQATSLRPASGSDGSQGWLVEGIEDDPENSSFDMVTKAGAGGRVRSLMESLYDESHEGEDNDEGELDMGGMTLLEALDSDEVKGHINGLVESAVTEKLPSIREEALGQAREEVKDELAGARYLRLSAKARSLIEAAKLPEAFQADLLEAYGVTDDGDAVKPGAKLALIEAETGDDEEVTKTATKVLEDSIEADVKRERAKLSEAAPTVPLAPGPGGGGDGETPAPSFGGEGSDWATRARDMGLDPEKFGATKVPEPAKAD